MRSIIILIFLCGCAVQPVAVPVQVKLPVAIACAPMPLIEPDWNLARVADDASATEKLKAALADPELSKAYIGELKAELIGCS